jgi:arsenate reductase
MAGEYVLWFDPRSSESQRALALLRERGVEPALRRFLEEPPVPDELEALLARLATSPHDLARPSADEYQALRLSERTAREALLQALSQHPRILVSPILVHGARALVARPPERVLELLPARARAASGL